MLIEKDDWLIGVESYQLTDGDSCCERYLSIHRRDWTFSGRFTGSGETLPLLLIWFTAIVCLVKKKKETVVFKKIISQLSDLSIL